VAAHVTPEEVIDRFWTGLTQQAATEGWVVGRVRDSGFSRGFVLVRDPAVVEFKVRVSQVSPGFWGLPYGEAEAIVAGKKEHNVLLTSSDSGYVIRAARLPILIGQFSKSDTQHSYKINEEKLRRERSHFRSLVDAWRLLRPADRA